MSDAVLVALITTLGLILSGVLVEMVRTRKVAEKSQAQMLPNGGRSMRDAVDRIARDVTEVSQDVAKVRDEQSLVAARLSRVEAHECKRRWL